eukprot:1010911_1
MAEGFVEGTASFDGELEGRSGDDEQQRIASWVKQHGLKDNVLSAFHHNDVDSLNDLALLENEEDITEFVDSLGINAFVTKKKLTNAIRTSQTKMKPTNNIQFERRQTPIKITTVQTTIYEYESNPAQTTRIENSHLVPTPDKDLNESVSVMNVHHETPMKSAIQNNKDDVLCVSLIEIDGETENVELKQNIDLHHTCAEENKRYNDGQNINRKVKKQTQHVLTFSKPHNIHILPNYDAHSTSVANPSASISIDVHDVTEDSVVIDILTEMLLQPAPFDNGMVQCSNRTDTNYDAAFTYNGSECKSSTNRNDARRQNSDDRNNRNSDDKKQNDDKDDKKYDPDEPHCLSMHCCNHLRECAECGDFVTRKSEHIKLLKSLLNTLQQQHEYHVSFEDMFCKAIKKRIKSKNKFKSMVCDSITESKPHRNELYPSYRAKKNIKLSRRLTQKIIPKTIKAPISNVYSYMEKSIGMQYNDRQIGYSTNTKYHIMNFDFYDNKYNEPLYCVMERMRTASANYKWQMQDQLFTAHQAIALAGGPLPLSSRIQLQRMSGGHDITQNTFDPQFIRRILKQCKWNTIPVFRRKNNKQRLTLSITQEQLNPMIAQSLLNIQNDTKCLL